MRPTEQFGNSFTRSHSGKYDDLSAARTILLIVLIRDHVNHSRHQNCDARESARNEYEYVDIAP